MPPAQRLREMPEVDASTAAYRSVGCSMLQVNGLCDQPRAVQLHFTFIVLSCQRHREMSL